MPRPRMRILLDQASKITYLLRDLFTTNRPATLNGTAAMPGPGTRTVVDSEKKLSVNSGALNCAGGKATPAWGDPDAYYAAISRVIGRSLFWNITPAGTNLDQAVALASSTTATNSGHVFWFSSSSSGSIRASDGSLGASLPNMVSYTTIPHRCAIVLRSFGAIYLDSTGSDWTVLNVGVSYNDAALYPHLTSYNGTGPITNLRAVDLPSPWDTDYGIATQRLAGARSAGDTFTHEANCLIEWMVTTLPTLAGNSIRFRFRVQGYTPDNLWQVNINNAGDITLFETVDNSATSRGTAAAAIANGQRLVIVADGSTIKVYANNVLKITYASATNFATCTAGKLYTLDAASAVSDLISWPRTISGAALTAITNALAGTPAPLLLDQFTDSGPFGLVPGNAEPGPGTRVATANVSLIGGDVVLLQNDIFGLTNGVTRQAGRCLLFTKDSTYTDFVVGFSSAQPPVAPNGYQKMNIMAGNAFIKDPSTTNITSDADSIDNWAIILRSDGAYFLGHNKTTQVWQLLYADNNVPSATLYASAKNYAATSAKIKNLRAVDLPAPWNSDYGLATQRLAGARTLYEQFTHEGNCIIEFVYTTLPNPNGAFDVTFRMQDLSNRWYVSSNTSGELYLYERVATVDTIRGYANPGTITAGMRVVVIADGSTIKIFAANVLKITYASATNFQTATTGRFSRADNGSVISDIISWPRYISGAALSALNRV